FAAAAALGRYAGPPGGEADGDVPAAGLPVAQGRLPAMVDGLWWDDRTHTPRVFDPGSGAWASASFPDGDAFERATVAPWVDARGRSLVAGRWLSRDGGGEGNLGIACYRFPDGEVVGRLPTDVAAVSPPCWFPDRSPRVLFPGADGVLYRAAFDRADP